MADSEQDVLSKLHRTLVENARDVITLIDEEGVIKYQSPSIKVIFGYSPDEIIDRNVFEFIHEDDHKKARESLQQNIDHREDVPALTIRFLHKDQSWRHVEVVGQILDGDIPGLVLNTRDITEQEEVLIELRRSDESFRAAFYANSTISTISIPETGEFLNVNDTWVNTLGWSREEAIGKTALELNVWGNKENRNRIVSALREKGKLRQFSSVIYTRTGEQRRILLDAELLDLQGNTRMFFSALDITEQEEIQEQLRHAQKLEAVGQLTGSIAHDFNNLLSVILGHTDLARLSVVRNLQLTQSLDAIERSAQSGAELIQQLLAFSRKQRLNPESFVLGERIKAMLTLLRASVGKDVEIQIESGEGNWLCHVDPIQLESALLNMAVNARDAMTGRGCLKFVISSTSLSESAAQPLELQPGDYVQLEIIDDGKGMAAEIVEHAFEPFFTTKASESGTGLGLSMVYGFVKQSGGHISIASDRQENGTAITLLLPRGEEESQVNDERSNHVIQEQKNKRVLLVEDDDNVRLLVSKLLGSLKLDVQGVANASEAGKFITEPIDLLVTDVMLPGPEKGPDIARKLRTIQPEVAILYMSGFHPGVLSAEDLAQHHVDFIQKPFSRHEFSSRIEALFHS